MTRKSIDQHLQDEPKKYYPVVFAFLWSTVVLTYFILERPIDEGVFNGFLFALAFVLTHYLLKTRDILSG